MAEERKSQSLLSMAPMLKNLVILIRFSDHKHRTLPSPSDVDILFNKVGGDPILAPTGSIRDVFTVNSYEKFMLDSEIVGWVDLPGTEAYYADGASGYGTSPFFEALDHALNILDDEVGVNFGSFDADGDGKVDMVTLIHSGYAAENPGFDADGAAEKDRIWSHHWLLPSYRRWTSSSGLIVHQYSTSPSLWELSGSSIGRIGVIAHEIGHCLGLPDLYGTILGDGAGNYDFMSNHWGFGPYALLQLYPPIMSPWTKIKAGWLDPILIKDPGTYAIEASALAQMVYRIDIGGNGTEYLLIENRQPIGFELFLPQGGLAIWHIDEEAPDVEGYPGQPGRWPENGKHYRVALLQADGQYDLERGNQDGDAGDLFHQDGVDSLGPSTTLLDGPFPNTDAYQDGSLRNTGIQIFNIGKSNLTMSFSIDFMDSPETTPPTIPVAPRTPMPTSVYIELRTTFTDNNGAAGNMFDVLPKRDITVHRLELHTSQVGPTIVEVWIKPGTHVSFERDALAWSRLLVAELDARGRGMTTLLDVGSIHLFAGKLQSFYVAVMDGKLLYTNGEGTGSIAVSNDDLIVYEGVGKATPFGYTFNDRIWNGAFHYSATLRTPSPTCPPTSATSQLETTYTGGSGQAGNMFDVLAYQDIFIKGFDLHIFDTMEVGIEILTKEGSFVGSERECGDWVLVANTSVVGTGIGNPTPIPLTSVTPVLIERDRIQAFYVTVIGDTGMRYTPVKGQGTHIAEDNYLAIFVGAGVAYPCKATFWNRVWNGAIHYEAA